MKKIRYITILLIILLIALCAVGSSDWLISNVVSFSPSLKIPVYVNKVVEFDYNSSGVNLREKIPQALKFKTGSGDPVNDITLSTNALDEDKILGIPDTTLTTGNTYAYNGVYVILGDSSKYCFAGTYTEDGGYFDMQSVMGTFQLLVKYKTVQIGLGSITTNNDGTETKINSFSSDSKWYTIEDALSNSNSNSNTKNTVQIVKVCANTSFTSLGDDVTGYTDENERTIKSGVTLALPFDGTTINNTNQTYDKTSLYKDDTYKKLELTIPDNITITNRGIISIGGSTTGGNNTQSEVAGGTTEYYAQITLGKGAKIESYGDINAYGFIVKTEEDDTSEVIMNSGTLLMPFIVVDHRGGSAFAAANNDLKGAPFNRFYLQNVTSKVVIKSGANLKGWANLYASSKDNTTAINYIGNDSTYLLQLKSGSSTELKYDKTKKITTWDIYGSANINALQMKIVGNTVSTADVLFPITWLWNINFIRLNESVDTIVESKSQSLKIMPGGVLTIGEGVTFKIPQIYVYDKGFIDNYDKGLKYDTGKGDGKLNVYGTLEVQEIAGYVDAKGDNANLKISGGVTITTYDLQSYTGSSITAKPVWRASTKSLEGPIYCYSGNERGFIVQGNYTSKNNGWLTDDSKFAIIYNFVYHDSAGNEITPETQGNPNNQTFHTKEDLVLKSAVLDGFEFKGWYTSSDFAEANAITTINGNTYYRQTITLYGLFEELPEDVIQYTVNYQYNATINGEESTKNIFNSTVLNSYELITLSQTGYTLEGWYKDNSFTTKVKSLTEDDFVDNSITLYAKWEVVKYKLSITKANYMATFNVAVIYNGVTTNYTSSTNNTSTNYTEVEHGATIKITATATDGYNLTLTVVNNGIQSSETEFTVNGEVTITTATEKTQGGICLVEGTLVTLADGTQKKVEDLTYDDLLLALNHLTGEFEASPMLVNLHAQDPSMFCRIIYLTFSDGTQIGVITEHAFFDLDLNEYVYINEESITDFIGHRFVKVLNKNGEFVSDEVILNQYVVVEKEVRRFSPVSIYINVVTEGLLSFTEVLTANGPTHGVINIFEFGEDLKYDEVKMQEDIEKYGLYTYDDYKEYLTYEEFIYFPWAYFKVCVGKGRLTWDDILWNIQYIHNDRMEQMDMSMQSECEDDANAPQPQNVSTSSNPFANVVIPPSTSSSSGGANSDGSNDDDND